MIHTHDIKPGHWINFALLSIIVQMWGRMMIFRKISFLGGSWGLRPLLGNPDGGHMTFSHDGKLSQ